MQGLAFDDPAWRTTFPHRVLPRQDEWLASLLWRCDEANHWKSGTTVVHLLHAACKHGSTNRFNIMVPSWVHLTQLSQLLAIPTSSIVATTYQSELDRLSLVPGRLFIQANASFQFSLCPACVAEKRMLTRPLMLPHITSCPEHHVTLQHACQCGARLRLFCRQGPPFTCSTCALDWGKLYA
jgi:hypothetical protein